MTARSRSSPLLSRTRSNGDDLAPKIAQSVFCTSRGLFRERKIIRSFTPKKGHETSATPRFPWHLEYYGESALPVGAHSGSQTSGARIGQMGAEEIQTVEASLHQRQPLAGESGATRSELAGPLADRNSTVDWIIRAG